MNIRISCLASAPLLAALLAGAAGAAPTNPTGHGEGPAGQTFIPQTPTAVVSAATDAKSASLELNYTGAHGALAVIAQAPLDQGSGYTNLVSLDGLAKATSVEVRYTYIRGGIGSGGALSVAAPENQATCWRLLARAQGHAGGAPTRPHPVCLPGDVSDAVADRVKAGTIKAGEAKAVLDAADAFASDMSVRPGPLWMVSVNGKAGYETHAYYDGSTLAKGSATKAPFQFGVSATRVATGGRLSGTLSYNHQEAYLDGAGSQKTQTLCPGGATGVLACVTGFIGAPKRQQQELLAAGVRYIGETPWGLPIGVGPSVTYETRSKAYAVQVPIYLVADKDKNLTGGIRYDWTSDTHHSTVGIFLTSAFSVLP